MNYIILYNPLSKRGSNDKIANKIKKRLEKNKNNKVTTGSLLEIECVSEYIDALDKDDKIVIVGGDGTLHYFANKLMDYEVKHDVYVARKAGTGNDFVRSIKGKDFLIRVNDYIKDLPYDLCEETNNKKVHFLNSLGIGLDAHVAHLVNQHEKRKTKWVYFKSVYKAFTEFKHIDLEIEVDGKKETIKKTLLAVVANAPYLGGGMKISPASKRFDDKLEMVVISGISKFAAVFVFPFIYIGWHLKFKKYVKVYCGKEFTIKTETDSYIQFDGETDYPRKNVHIFRK